VNYTKSVFLPFALWSNAVSVEEALAIVRFEEDFQEKEHGSIPAGQDYHGAIDFVDIATCTLLLHASDVKPLTKELILSLGDCRMTLLQNELGKHEERLKFLVGMANTIMNTLTNEKNKEPKDEMAIFVNAELHRSHLIQIDDINQKIDESNKKIEKWKMDSESQS